ncbi:Panacea domain-containing protein [Rhodocaloribacter sp.]
MTALPTYQPPKLDWDKLKTLVHYVCFKAPNPRKLGATKLNKILFYAEMEAFLSLGHPITGEVFVKQQFGPVPKHILSVLRELEKERAIAISDASGYHVYTGESYPHRQFFSLTRPTLEAFTGDEISIVDEVVDLVCNRHTAKSISEASHNIVWESAEIGEELPYFTALTHLLGEITAKDVAWARDVIARRCGEE